MRFYQFIKMNNFERGTIVSPVDIKNPDYNAISIYIRFSNEKYYLLFT